MKTLDQIKELYKSNTLDGRDIARLVAFLPEEDLGCFGVTLQPEYVGTHKATPLTREAILEQLKSDVAFGFEKALNKRGISASLMFEVVHMWNWILEEGLEDYSEDEGYAMYGLPLFKATALKYGFDNPIGDDTGSEEEYNE
jgi:hypothetical protein